MTKANNNFKNYEPGSLDAPYGAWFNTYDTDFQDPETGELAVSRALWVSVAGPIEVDILAQDGKTRYHVTYPHVAQGRWANHIVKIYAAGTTDTTLLVEI